MKFYLLPLLSLCLWGMTSSLSAQNTDQAAIKAMVENYKQDQRGPYKDIRWFCKDGTTRQAKDPCPDPPGGVQRARYKEEVTNLAKKEHLFLGQILATTPSADFWDADHRQSRLKQYQLEKFLRANDDGWILRKAQFYRGAIQAEDEEAWGIEFFQWLLAKDDLLQQHFFLIRQAARDIPHQGDNSKTQSVRAVSKAISDEYLPFMDLRIKIHGQPDAGDIQKVRAFRDQHRAKLSGPLLQKFDQLLTDMEIVYQPVSLRSLERYLKPLPKDSELRQAIADFIDSNAELPEGCDRQIAISDLLYEIRRQILTVKKPSARLALIDLSNQLEEILFKDMAAWPAPTLDLLLDKVYYLSQAAAGAGFLETWEWERIQWNMWPFAEAEVELIRLNRYLDRARSVVEWGAGSTRGAYEHTVDLFAGFEPLAYGFLDDRIRGSVLLPLGQAVSRLGDFLAQQANLSNKVLDIDNQSHIRGVNPGYAKGQLVVTDSPDEVEVSNDKIYVFSRPPSDLKPVAGIATVTEGNVVSHVQLLARNLGIPNAVVSNQNLEALKKYSGREVFYAVSNRGTVIMKLADQMSAEEKKLFEVKKRNENKVSVPVDKIVLSQTSVLNMREVKATDSGKLCGPKAANLGQLKQMFPEHVVEGLVIPFGIFRKHLDQPMPGQSGSYWEYLNAAFAKAKTMSDAAAETYLLQELEVLRTAIKEIPLQPDFLAELKEKFRSAFGQELGKVPVFLRSDTNMEDLKEFTGAGLNLTLFNVVDADRILQGIKDVWASPYTERSYKWRQRYLLNPENVFPSILIIPSVDVDYSGVLITKGIATGDPKDLTIAFSRGAGGAVDGQAAESYLLFPWGGSYLISPAREPFYNRLPATGGTKKMPATFESPILNDDNIAAIRTLAAEVREKLPKAPGIETQGPFDVELGFKDDQLWLFQVRPFVENKNAVTSTYLESITPQIPGQKKIAIQSPL